MFVTPGFLSAMKPLPLAFYDYYAHIDQVLDTWFIDSVLFWIPAVLLLLNVLSCFPRPSIRWWFFGSFLTTADLAPYDLVQVSSPAWKQQLLLALSALLVPPSLAGFSYSIVRGSSLDFDCAAATVTVVTWMYSMVYLCHYTITRPPYLLMILWITTAAAEAAKIFVALESGEGLSYLAIGWRVIDVLIIIFGLVYVAGSYPLLDVLPCRNVAAPGSTPTAEETCPEDGVTLWQWLSFSFFSPLLNLARQRTLNEADVWQLSPFFQHRLLFNRYLRLIKQECPPKNGRVNILWILIRSNSLDLFIGVMVQLWSTVVGFVSTYAIKRILDGLSVGDRNSSFKFAALHFLCNMSFAQFDLYGKWHTRRCYERSRGQLFSILHEKALTRKDMSGVASARPMKDAEGKDVEEDQSHANIGKISNLMGADAYQVAQRFWEFAGVITSPLKLILSLAFLYHLLGWSALLGGGMVGIAYLLNWPLIKFDVMYSKAFSAARDRRMTIANETIQSIRFLKYMGWENKWASKVHDSRQSELKLRVKQMILSALISFIWIWVPTVVLLVSFWAFTTILHQPLTVSIAFTSISLFSQLQWALQALPSQITAWLRAFVSVKRIEDFLCEEDVPDWVTSLTRPQKLGDATLPEPGLVLFKAASFTWPQSEAVTSSERFKLGPLDCAFPVGKLTLVTGATGAGKSSLLGSILGELDCIEGSVQVDKSDRKMAYAAQNPWLESASIRDNIVFQSEFDQTRYDAVLSACALKQDLGIFPHGDETEIGEKGISLSGGQKARIALARAIYSPAKILLLDDPLSAVDLQTARSLVDEGLRGFLLRDRTVVLVTHHIRLCRPAASLLIHIKAGKVDYVGSPTEFEADPSEAAKDQSENEDPESQSEATTLSEAARSSESETPKVSTDQNKSVHDGRLVEEEKRHEGRVSISTYATYLRAAGWGYWVLLLALLVYGRLTGLAAQWALKAWGEAYPHSALQLLLFPDPTKHFPRPDLDVTPWIRLYLIIALNGGAVILAGLAVESLAQLKASRKLFSAMLQRVVRAPTRWYDVTPTGRILNRFVSDIDTVDFALLPTTRSAASGSVAFLLSLIVMILVVPSFAPIAIFISWLYIRLAPDYIKTSRDLRRLESVARSPMFQNFSNLLHGIQSIRAFAAEDRYQNLFYKSCDTFQTMDHHYWLANFWLMWRYDCLGSVVVFLTTAFALASGVGEGFAAISVVQAEMFAQATRSLVSVFAQLELDFNAVERITEYLKIPQEAPAIIEGSRPPAYWPSDTSGLVVEKLVVKYAVHLPPALNSISFEIEPQQKVGVVGRTGSGKSTLAMCLLRILEPTEGRIILDGIDLAKIGLEDLRTRITIVSQDVTLFEGTIRGNLDPLDLHTDEECWDVLRRCNLATPTAIYDQPQLSSGSTDGQVDEAGREPPHAAMRKDRMMVESLDMRLSEGGKSFSAGQRQMLALARAMLRRTKVVIMDEATSSIDLPTDAKIQATIRDCMNDSMVITIAHRLFTIIDYDKIIVLKEGRVAEVGSPRSLIKEPNGEFRKLCQLSADWESLRRSLLGTKVDGTE